MVQDLCPRCGSEVPQSAPACPSCGSDLLGSPAFAGGTARKGLYLRGIEAIAASIALVGLFAISFGVGWHLSARDSTRDAAETGATPLATSSERLPRAQLGHVRFAERLGQSLELESYRTQFARDGTIAWRVEFLEPPGVTELTVEIAWQSIRERMLLSRYEVVLSDDQLAVIGSDEVAVADLTPTAGLYAVSYFAGETKLAEGVFEVLPPNGG
jgi:hypothetical protein